MRKITTDFSFDFPLNHKIVRNLKITTEHVGNLHVEGVGYFNPDASLLDVYERYGADIDFVRWNGVDIKSVLEATGFLDEIKEAAIQHVSGKFEERRERA